MSKHVRNVVRKGGFSMNKYRAVEIDNRDAAQMYEYLEARIDVLKRRIFELEKENQVLRIERINGVPKWFVTTGSAGELDSRNSN